ncbi:hypothetical protein [Azospirillum sp.]|uniref:hypothetical protein n=1 Tax=Azospirillum sp. TaxID=34012 RepID=UPI00262908A3|nr:hypothetical protein [Azospirillum sp.]
MRDEAAEALEKSGWAESDHLLRHLDMADGGQDEYQEYVYFHPFVRDFLFGKDEKSKEIRLFLCPDYVGLDAAFDLDADGFAVQFRVERANMYLFDAGIAVLALEIVNDGDIIVACRHESMQLKHAQIIQERLRRAYPPFWFSGGQAGLVAKSARWRRKDGQCSPEHAPLSQADMIDPTVKSGEPPLAGHWAALLKPLLSPDKIHIRQVVDERIPQMLYLRVDDPAAIARGDWVRLAMCDEVGDLPLPYAEDFLADFEQRHCYDRHWIKDVNGVLNVGAASRYLFSGYGFVAVGGESNWFFKNILPTHVRRHYFQLALLAQFEFSFLVSEIQRIKLDSSIDDRNHSFERMMEFTEKYWFITISKQMQAKEMMDLWRKFLDTNSLYEQVLKKSHDLNQLSSAIEDRRASEATTRLTVAALLVAIPSLATGFLGINLLSFKDGKFEGWPSESLSFVGQALGVAFLTVLERRAPNLKQHGALSFD